MLKNKLMLLGLLAVISLSSCGIFGKGCGCPKFGYNVPLHQQSGQLKQC